MYSQNGWRVDRSLIRTYTIPDSTIRISLRMGDASVVLLWLAGQYNAHVEPLTQVDTGGFVIKGIEGGVSMSNHASGTAMDLRWNKHPVRVRHTFDAAQLAVIRHLLAACNGVIRWGGDYITRADEMHWEIVGSQSQLAALANRIRADDMPDTSKAKPTATNKAPAYPGHSLSKGTSDHKATKTFQAKLKARGWHIEVDGSFGPDTEHIVRQFQHEKHLSVDGVVGPHTWSAIWNAPTT